VVGAISFFQVSCTAVDNTSPDGGVPDDGGPADAGQTDGGAADGGVLEFTFTAQGVIPNTGTVGAGGTVRFVNGDISPHQPASDPHPTHTLCPELNGPVLQSGGTFDAVMGAGPKSCGFHDHVDALNASMTGTVAVP